MTILRFASVTALAVTAAVPALAAANTHLATHGAWEAFAYTEKAGKVCYAASMPQSRNGGAKTRQAFITVTHRKADKSTNVVSVSIGQAYKAGSAVEMAIGAQEFKLFTSGDGAWAKDSATDAAIVAAMRRGNTATVRATPAKGSAITDTYSLSGISAALAEIGTACGIR